MKHSLKNSTAAIALIATLSACSFLKDLMAPRVDSQIVMSKVRANDYKGALELATQRGFFSMDKMLRHLDLGGIYFLDGQYYHALKEFEQAQQLADNSQALIKLSYAGETHEISMLHFYLSLAHFRLYQTGKQEAYVDEEGKEEPAKTLTDEEKQKHLEAAGNVLLAWNSWTSMYASEKKADFTRDLLERTYGAFIQAQGKDNQQETARKLYESIPDLLNNDYAGKYPSAKKYAAGLKKYATENRATLPNVEALVLTGFVEPKVAKTIKVPFSIATAVAAAKGDSAFVSSVVPADGLSFEIVEVKKPEIVPEQKIIVKDKKGKIIAEKSTVVSQPVSEIIYHRFGGDKTAEIQRKTVALQTGCLAGIRANYPKYAEHMQKADAYKQQHQNKKFAQHMGHAAVYAGAARAACTGSKADTRAWEVLPANITEAAFKLKTGDYTAELSVKGQTVARQDFSVKEGSPALLNFVRQ